MQATATIPPKQSRVEPRECDYAAYKERMEAHWDHLKVVVGEDIDIYQQLKRTKRSSGYKRNILNARECKIAHYHEQMDRKIRS